MYEASTYTRGASGTGARECGGCSHHPETRNNWMWHALVDKVMISPRLDLMILEIFSSLNYSMILR